MYYFKYLPLLFISFVACVSQKPNVSTTKAITYPVHTSSAITNERIYFINFGTKKVGNTDSCFVINTIEVDGKLSHSNEEPHDAASGNNYLCKVYDSNEKLIYQEVIINPLQHRVDLYSEDGKIESKELTIQEAEFSIRFQQPLTKASIVTIEKEVAGKSNMIICKSNLK